MTPSARPSTITRSRPRDRKEQIIKAAGELFYRRGYQNVSTGAIAESVGITAGALYRHFSGKQDLLAQALIDVFERGTTVVQDDSDSGLEAMVAGLAATAAARRDLGILWNREARHLDEDHRAQLQGRFFSFFEGFSAQLGELRPELSKDDADLLSWCALGVLTSPSYHSTAMELPQVVVLLTRTAIAVCTTPLAVTAGSASSTPVPTGLSPQSRHESILAAATRLFYERGYQAVTMDDIGAEVGITSTAVYKYFDSKAELLNAVIARASEPLSLGLSQALAAASTPAEGLSNALDAYVDFALVHHDLVGILVSEVTNLPQPQRHGVRRAQHDYVAEWVRLLTESRADLSLAQARYVVQAVLTLVNDATRTAAMLERPTLAGDLRLIGHRVITVELGCC
jgi:AcrR family transcriptional regulator